MTTMLYRPGTMAVFSGVSVDYRVFDLNNPDDAFEAKGWRDNPADCASVAEKAIEAAEALEAATDDVSPSARDELEQMARSLGVPFNARTKDETLIARIAEATDE